jgi:CheY-like chemotaxis protein
MVFARSSDLAYSQIKQTHPNLVILCGNIQDLDGSRLLTMLKLDPDTRGIPLISYAAPEWEDPDRAASEPADDDDAAPRGPGLRMN